MSFQLHKRWTFKLLKCNWFCTQSVNLITGLPYFGPEVEVTLQVYTFEFLGIYDIYIYHTICLATIEGNVQMW